MPTVFGVTCRAIWRTDEPCRLRIMGTHRCCQTFRPVENFSGIPEHDHACKCGARFTEPDYGVPS